MKRILRLRGLWDYLPAFRVVAEHEHLPTASRAIGVSPPALSRAIRLLEAQLGHALFDRAGARLRLNAGGRLFLASVRAAMRTLDEGVDEVLDGARHPSGELLVTFPPEAAALVAGWIAALDELAPDLALREIEPPTDVAIALRRGDLDLALVSSPPVADELSSFEVGLIRWRLYRGRKVRRIAPPWRVIATPGAPWPSDEARIVAGEVADLAAAAHAIASGTSQCAFLPEALATAHRLVAVGPVSAVTSLFAAHRTPVAHHPATEVALTALRRAARVRPRRG